MFSITRVYSTHYNIIIDTINKLKPLFITSSEMNHEHINKKNWSSKRKLNISHDGNQLAFYLTVCVHTLKIIITCSCIDRYHDIDICYTLVKIQSIISYHHY